MSIYAEGLSGASTRCIVGTRHLSIVSSVDSDLKRRLAKGGVVAILINVVRVGVPINNLSFRPGGGGAGLFPGVYCNLSDDNIQADFSLR